MAYTPGFYEGNGSNRLFNIPFSYTNRSHVKVELNGVLTTAFTFVNDSQIQLNVAPANGVTVKVYRVTPHDTRLITFSGVPSLNPADIDRNTDQALGIIQEQKWTQENHEGRIQTAETTLVNHEERTTVLESRADVLEADVLDLDGRFTSLRLNKGDKGDPGNLVMTPRYSAKRPLVTFVDDDGDIAVWTRLKPVFEAAGVPCVVAIPSDYVGMGNNHLTAGQLLTLQGMGWEIASHSKTHTYFDPTPGAMSDAFMISELADSKAELTALGLEVNNFVYPGGGYNERFAQLAREHYRSASILGEQHNIGALHTWTLGRRHFGGNTFTLAQQQAFVDAGIASNSWMIFVTHANAATLSASELTDLGSLIAYIQGQGVPIVTLNQGMNEVGNLLDLGYYPWPVNRAAGFPQKPYTVVDSEGNVTTNPLTSGGPGVVVSALNAYTAANVPTDFPLDKITYTTVDAAGKTTFPDANPGTLTTMRLGNKDGAGEGWTRQTYHSYNSNASWVRTWDNVGGAWRTWDKVTLGAPIVLAATNAHTADNLLSAFEVGAITRTRISAAGKATFPEAAAGELTTERLFFGSDDWARQQYRIYQTNKVYTRYWTGSAWSAWDKSVTEATQTVVTSAVDAYTADTLLSGFGVNQITHTRISAAGKATFPEGKAGTLITSRLFSGYDAWGWQQYRIYQEAAVYERYWTGSAWSSWTLRKQAAAQADTTAADLAALKVDFNALLAKLRAAGLMA